MNDRSSSPAYKRLRKRGPFPGRIDPWSEAGRYFQQIHGGIIGNMLEVLQDPLDDMGYIAGRETSLQIAKGREPDLYVKHKDAVSHKSIAVWDYALAAAEVLAEPGVAVDWDVPELDALTIKEKDTGRFVTLVEVISPRNKADNKTIFEYQERRDELLDKGINVVEMDLTRSVKRLLDDKLAYLYPYHVVVYLPQQLPRLIGIDFEEALKRVALPLDGEVIPVELQAIYDHAYQVARMAGHMVDENHYTETNLPFPSLLTEAQRQEALTTVAAWFTELERLRK